MNVVASTPLLIVSGAALAALAVGIVPWGRVARVGPSLVAVAGIGAAGGMSAALWGDRQVAYAGNLYADRFSLLVNLVVLAAALAAIALAWREPAAVDRRGEVAGLLLFSTAGMMLVAGAGNLIVIFLGVELLSVALYVLCALEVWRQRSLESGMKYLIVGAVGSAVLLYGLTFLYGTTGSTELRHIGSVLAGASLADEPLVGLAMALVIVGLGFKASAVPFHMWTPDAYTGAPTPVTAFMSVAPKAAAFVAIVRVLVQALTPLAQQWTLAVMVLAALTMVLGNVVAVTQRNVKRMLAYSSIAHTGYMLVGLAAYQPGQGDQGVPSLLFYSFAYVFMNVGAFGVVIWLQARGGGTDISDYNGLASRAPLAAAALAVCLFSLLGVPPLLGFWAKYYVIVAAVQANLIWLAVLVVLTSAVSAYFYLRVFAVMYFGDVAQELRPQRAPLLQVGLGLTVLATIAFGLVSGPLLALAQKYALF